MSYVCSSHLATTLHVLRYGRPFVLDPKGEVGSESKRLKGLGIGSSDGPVSLDDIRRLEKSNAVSLLLQDGKS